MVETLEFQSNMKQKNIRPKLKTFLQKCLKCMISSFIQKQEKGLVAL